MKLITALVLVLAASFVIPTEALAQDTTANPSFCRQVISLMGDKDKVLSVSDGAGNRCHIVRGGHFQPVAVADAATRQLVASQPLRPNESISVSDRTVTRGVQFNPYQWVGGWQSNVGGGPVAYSGWTNIGRMDAAATAFTFDARISTVEQTANAALDNANGSYTVIATTFGGR